jgi:hypothetical protein
MKRKIDPKGALIIIDYSSLTYEAVHIFKKDVASFVCVHFRALR